MINAFGKTYETVQEAQARIDALTDENAQWGESDDRVTEQILLRAAIAAEQPAQEDVWEPGNPCRTCGGPTLAARPGHPEEQGEYCEKCGYSQDVYTVQKQEYEVPCEHPLCDTLHRRFMVRVTMGGVTEMVHEKKRIEWIVLRNGERAPYGHLSDSFDTKREAVAALRRAGML